jgi:hypothetical protein
MATLFIHTTSGIGLLVQFPHDIKCRIQAYNYAKEIEEAELIESPEESNTSIWHSEDYRLGSKAGYEKPLPENGILLFALSKIQVVLGPLNFRPSVAYYRVLIYVTKEDAMKILFERAPFSCCSFPPRTPIVPREQPYDFTGPGDIHSSEVIEDTMDSLSLTLKQARKV